LGNSLGSTTTLIKAPLWTRSGREHRHQINQFLDVIRSPVNSVELGDLTFGLGVRTVPLSGIKQNGEGKARLGALSRRPAWAE
jgi:hypothetical protein